MSPNFNNADADPNLPAAQINMSNELKGNLRQVLHTLEAHLQEDVELEQEALPKRPSSKRALSMA